MSQKSSVLQPAKSVSQALTPDSLNVYNGARENVGEIKDIVIARDMLDGYILSVGGFLGVGQRYVAVKPDAVAITYDPARGKWLASINATKEQLKSAPEFKYEGRWKAS
jgi:hypothetical protein